MKNLVFTKLSVPRGGNTMTNGKSLEECTVAELKEIARDTGKIEGLSAMKKADLISAIRPRRVTPHRRREASLLSPRNRHPRRKRRRNLQKSLKKRLRRRRKRPSLNPPKRRPRRRLQRCLRRRREKRPRKARRRYHP
jgi:hypothetical protein